MNNKSVDQTARMCRLICTFVVRTCSLQIFSRRDSNIKAGYIVPSDYLSLTLCCFVVYSTRRFVVCLSVCHFVLVFFSPFSIAITSLGEERANLSAFRAFVRLVCV